MTESGVQKPELAGGSEASRRLKLVIILPRGEAIRNIVYSGSIDRLAAEADITALSVIPSEELRQILSRTAVSLLPLSLTRERWLVGAVRDLLDSAHGRNLWSSAAQLRWKIRDYEAQRPTQKLNRWAKKLAVLPFSNPLGVRLLSHIERKLSRWLANTDEFVRLFQQIQPDLVFNASHVHSVNAIQPIQAAQWLGIPTATFIFSWDNLTSQGRIFPAYDHYLVWNENLKRQLLDIYPAVRPGQTHITGTPQFDFHFQPEYYWTREQFCSHAGADPSRPIVLYTTGMANHMPGEVQLVERIGDIVATLPGRPQLLVRVYAKDLTGRFDELKSRRKDILFPPVPWEPAFLTPRREDLFLLTNTLRHCAAGINIASTISLELCMFDKPAINLAYNPEGVEQGPVSLARYYEFDHYKPVVDSGAVELAYSEAELRALLLEALDNPGKRRVQRKAFIDRMFADTLDGKSGRRVAESLLALARMRNGS